MAATRQCAATMRRSKKPKTAKVEDSAPALDPASNPAAREVLGGSFMEAFDSAMRGMEWAEDEIEKAGREHPEHVDLIWHSFHMLAPTHELMMTEMVYRAHCREILARVIAGEDTRPGTAAECCIACCQTSQLAPMNVAGVGLYMRMWKAAGFPEIDYPVEHHEALRGEAINEHERTLRRQLSCESRQLPDVIEHSPLCPVTLAKGNDA
jgi:hypothetical protein